MRSCRFLLFGFIAIQTFLWPASAEQPRFRVLAFYSQKAEGDHVQFAEDAVTFLRDIADREHFTFEATTSWEDLNDSRLRDIQLVIWLNESPARVEQRSAFERYIARGGAWLGFHAAGYNDKDTNWPWFVDFMGGAVFYTNSWPPLPAKLTIDDRTHPVSAGLPKEFQSPSNEWYVWKPSPRLNPNVRVLATFDPSNYPIGFKDVLSGGDLPVVWTNTKYRMIYMNMGHGDKILTSPLQNQLIENAVNWLGMGEGTAPHTEPEAIGQRISPHGIVVNSRTGKFYAVSTTHDVVTVLNPKGHFLSRIQVGKEPEAVAVDPDANRIYVANSRSGTVSVIDGGKDEVIATVPVGDLPYIVAANQQTNKVYVSRTFASDTAIIDGKTNTVTHVQAGAGDAVAAESLDDATYLVNYENTEMTVFDGVTDKISKIKAANHLWALAANPATKTIYAASAGGSNVLVINATTRAARLVNTGQVPCAMAVDTSSGKVFIVNYASNSVTVLGGDDSRVLDTVKVNPRPQAIAIDPSNHRVYVASTHSGTTAVLDATNDSVVDTVKTENSPFSIAVNPESRTAVLLGLTGNLLVIDGTTLAVSSP